MTAVANQKLMSAREAAKRLGVSPTRVRQFCKEGRIGELIDGRYVISEEEIRLFKQIERPTGRPPANRSHLTPTG